MNRTVDLGALGEAAAERLFDGVELGSGFEPYLLTSPHPKALAELRRRLAAEEGQTVFWNPSVELAQELPEKCAAIPIDGTSRPRIWIEAETFDPIAWRAFLRSLNFQRDRLIRMAPILWILAGPPELQRLFQESALDLATGTKQLVFPEEPKPLATYGTPPPIRWWHLSDFHFKADERWDRRGTLQALLRLAEEETAGGNGPHLVFLTGDIAYSGKTAEYRRALLFLRELGRKLGLEPREHFFVVPGNHDVDRARIARGETILVENLESQADIEGIFSDAATLGMLGRRLEAFYGFTGDLLGPARAWQPTRPWRVDVLEIGGIPLGILQLNSAWTCGPGEGQGTVWIGSPQVEEALQVAADALVRVVLVHHPIADLADPDRAALETRFTAPDGAHFLLRGHLHRGRSKAASTPDGRLFELAAGALYTEDPGFPRGFFSTEVDLAAGRATFKSWGYEAAGRGFWHPKGIYENARDGVWSVELPPQLRLGAPPAQPVLTEARRDILSARFREAAAAYHGRLRFIGFADSRPRPTARVPELFVPLRLKSEGTGEGKKLSTLELLRRLSSRDSGPARIVVLGGPGSGKTTLSTFVTVVLAGEARLAGLDVPGDLLPLLLPFRDYVASSREHKDRGILDFLKLQASTELQLSLPESFLEKAMEEGRAVLILDGLDEVGSQDERVTMLKRVEAFCSAWKNLPILVTSRITGYGEAPLPRERGGFEHFLLEDFDAGDQHSFVRNWYQIQEPDDPVARERGIHELTLAISEDPSVGALARSPILATLIALVHRYEAHLPGERALLYDLCVKTLLETWPAARRRTFLPFDARLQRTYLEDVAFRIHEYPAGGSRVSIPFQLIATIITDVLRDLRGLTEAEATYLASQWLKFLVEDTGLLVEEQPGVLGFLHLSLYEFLASRGWERYSEQPSEIAYRVSEARWREISLLMVGYHSADTSFLNSLFETFQRKSTPEGWNFLFRCLRDEAAFNDEQRTRIFDEAGQATLDGQINNPTVFEELTRFSNRHREWAKSQMMERLSKSKGADLQGAIALALHRWNRALEILKVRKDAEVVATDLLEFWPSRIGLWAANNSTKQTQLAWAFIAPRILSPPFLAGALRGEPSGLDLAGASITLTYLRAFEALAVTAKGTKAAQPGRPDGFKLPIEILLNPPNISIHPYPLIWNICKSDGLGFSRYFHRHLLDAETFSRRKTFPRLNWVAAFPENLGWGNVKALCRSSNELLYSSAARVRFEPIFRSEKAVDFQWKESSSPRPMDPPSQKDKRNKITRPSRLDSEAWISYKISEGESKEIQAAFTHFRLSNLLTWQHWQKIENSFVHETYTEAPLLAAYLALGWSQANTTWRWPDSNLWRSILGGPPPDHWLPRSQWYFCWWLYQPESDEFRGAFYQALEEGMSDPEHPGLAAAIRAVAIPKES